jgi:iron complex outermembrane recepter protein
MKTLALSIIFAFAACAQQGLGVVTGQVTDPSNAVIPGIAVSLESAGMHDVLRSITDEHGFYSIPRVQPGEYNLLIKLAGFRSFRRDGVTVQPGQVSTEDVKLEVGTLAQQMTITAKAPRLEAAIESETKNFKEVLEIRQVRESSAKDIGEALSNIDGIWKVRKAGIANDVVLRGFQQGNLNILIDGLRLHGACPSAMDPAAFHVDFAEVQYVEVTKGAFDIRNQGSLGGTVNIINKNPERGLRITPNFSVGSFGYFNPSITGSLSRERVWGLAGYSFRRSDPYLDGSGRRVTDYSNFRDTTRNSSAFDINTSWFKFGAAPRNNHRFELGYTHQGSGQVLYPALMMDALYDNADRINATYHIAGVSDLISQFRAQAYYSRVEHWMTDELRTSSVGAARPYSMGTLAATKALGGKLEAELSNLTIGVEAFRRFWNGVNSMRMMGMYMDQATIPNVAMTSGGAYAQYGRTFFGRLQLTAGARIDAAATEARSQTLNPDLYWAYKGTRSLSRTDSSPSGDVWLAYSLPRNLQVFAGVGHTMRFPDLQERYYAAKRNGSDWVGNPELRPTKNTEADLGIQYKGRYFTLRPTLFYSRLRDFVTVNNQAKINPTPFVVNSMARSYENVDAKIYGGELGYSLGFTRSLLLFGGLSYSRGVKEPRPEFRIFNRNLAEMPPLKSRTSLRYGNKRFFAEVEGIATNAQNRADLDLRESRTAGYAVFNLKTGIHTNKVNMATGIDNVLNRLYYENFAYQRDPYRLGIRMPEPGRSVYLTASYMF